MNSDQGTKVSNNAVFVDFPADTSTACLVFIVGRSYSGSSGDGGSAEASATMTSLHHPVQMATATVYDLLLPATCTTVTIMTIDYHFSLSTRHRQQMDRRVSMLVERLLRFCSNHPHYH